MCPHQISVLPENPEALCPRGGPWCHKYLASLTSSLPWPSSDSITEVLFCRRIGLHRIVELTRTVVIFLCLQFKMNGLSRINYGSSNCDQRVPSWIFWVLTWSLGSNITQPSHVLSRSVVSDSLWPHGLQPARSHGILLSRILEWVAMPSSRGSCRPRDQTHIFTIGGLLTNWATREAH